MKNERVGYDLQARTRNPITTGACLATVIIKACSGDWDELVNGNNFRSQY